MDYPKYGDLFKPLKFLYTNYDVFFINFGNLLVNNARDGLLAKFNEKIINKNQKIVKTP